MSIQAIRSNDIYHGLPVYPDNVQGLTAIVVGANGISGHHMLRVLCESPTRWTKIYAISRRPPHGQWPSHVEHVSVDLLQAPDKVSEQMKARGVKADCVFFFAYIQPKPPDGGSIWSATEELARVNSQLLRTFLDALDLSHALPKRILLQLGAKYYGIHLGPTNIPQEETDPRIILESNFYYPQEDCLQSFCQKHEIAWNVTRPSWIPGAVPDAAMNLCLPLAIYASVQRHLGKKLEYPADLTAWETNQTMSSAMLNGYLSEWAVLTPQVQNQSFNASDDIPFTWGKFWPKLASRFGIAYTGPVTNDPAVYKGFNTPYDPPPRGFGPPAKFRFRFSLVEWARRADVQTAWRELAERYGLRDDSLGDVERVFGFGDAALGFPHAILLSTAKAKKHGFFGFVDSTESIFRVFQEFVDMKIVPPLP